MSATRPKNKQRLNPKEVKPVTLGNPSLFESKIDYGSHTLMSHLSHFLSRNDTSALAAVNLFTAKAMKDARYDRGKLLLKKPMLDALTSDHLLDAFFTDEKASAEEDDAAIRKIFSSLKNKGITNLEQIYLRFEKLNDIFDILTLNEDQLILLSQNEAAVNAWVKSNFHRLRDPIDDQGLCPIHYLGYNNHCEILRKLNKKINLEVYDKDGISLPDMAAFGNSVNVLHFLNERSFPDMQNSLLLALSARGGSMEAMLFCRNELSMKPTQYRNGENLHHSAMYGKSIAALRFCRDEYKMDMSAVDDNEVGAQHLAFRVSEKIAIFCRDELKLDMTAKASDGSTIVHFAAHESPELIEFGLKELKLTLEKVPATTAGRTLLSIAASNANIRVLKYLAEKNQDMKAVDSEGNGLVHWGAVKGSEVLRLARDEYKLDPQIKNNSGRSLLFIAIEEGNIDALYFGYHEFSLDPLSVDKLGQGLQHFLKVNDVSGLLACQILNLDLSLKSKYCEVWSDQLKDNEATLETMSDLLKTYPSSYPFPKKYITAWNTKENLSDRILAVVSCYGQGRFLREIGNESLHNCVQQFRKRVHDLKDANPIKLFYYLNFKVIDMLQPDQHLSLTIDNPLIACIRFVTHKTLQHIHVLHLQLKEKQEQDRRMTQRTW